jgi:hypothetical protein
MPSQLIIKITQNQILNCILDYTKTRFTSHSYPISELLAAYVGAPRLDEWQVNFLSCRTIVGPQFIYMLWPQLQTFKLHSAMKNNSSFLSGRCFLFRSYILDHLRVGLLFDSILELKFSEFGKINCLVLVMKIHRKLLFRDSLGNSSKWVSNFDNPVHVRNCLNELQMYSQCSSQF